MLKLSALESKRGRYLMAHFVLDFINKSPQKSSCRTIGTTTSFQSSAM